MLIFTEKSANESVYPCLPPEGIIPKPPDHLGLNELLVTSNYAVKRHAISLVYLVEIFENVWQYKPNPGGDFRGHRGWLPCSRLSQAAVGLGPQFSRRLCT